MAPPPPSLDSHSLPVEVLDRRRFHKPSFPGSVVVLIPPFRFNCVSWGVGCGGGVCVCVCVRACVCDCEQR